MSIAISQEARDVPFVNLIEAYKNGADIAEIAN